MEEILNIGSMLLGAVCVVLVVIGLAGTSKAHECDLSECGTCPFPCERRDDR